MTQLTREGKKVILGYEEIMLEKMKSWIQRKLLMNKECNRKVRKFIMNGLISKVSNIRTKGKE